jgi:hypothetical protein
MSNALAIAAVTAVLKDLLQDALATPEIPPLGTVRVMTSAPDQIMTGSAEPTQLGLFLHHVTQNSGWRNVGHPSRNGEGQRIANPPLALDLHYLLTAYGASELHREILLGCAMQVFHEVPVLTRKAIAAALRVPPNGSLPAELPLVAQAGLADQIEQIKIAPHVLNTEEISKLWTAFQAHYRPTVAYVVTVVLIESTTPARSAPPVLTRGRRLPGATPGEVREEGVVVQSDLVLPAPTLDELVLPQRVAIRLGERLSLRGHHLAGTEVRIRFRLLRGDAVLELPTLNATATDSVVQMPPPPPDPPPVPSPLNPASWQVGIYEVSIALVQGGIERETNRLPLALAPLIQIRRQPADALARLASLEVDCLPPVKVGQRVMLIVGERELTPQPFTAPTSSLAFNAPAAPDSLPTGSLPVRLRVDGIESLVVNRQATPPRFAQVVEIT